MASIIVTLDSTPVEILADIPADLPADIPADEDSSDEETEDVKCIVIDNGSDTLKVGFAGEDSPKLVIPSVVWLTPDGTYHFGNNDSSSLKRKYPIEHGFVFNWEAMEALWAHVIEELGINPKEYLCLISEPPMNPKYNREKTVQILFERFKFKGVYLSNAAVLSLYASGRTSGLVVMVGDRVTNIVPVEEGFPHPEAIQRLDIGGKDLTCYLARILMEKGYSFITSAELKIVRDIKEKLCYCTPVRTFERNNEEVPEKYYEVGCDGRVLTLDKECYLAVDVLFNPARLGMSAPGLALVVHSAITRCDVNVRPLLWKNIVLSGGSTLFEGLAERLKLELVDMLPAAVTDQIKVIAPPERLYSTWIGGSILSRLSSFKDQWIKSEQYEEEGPAVVHKSCWM